MPNCPECDSPVTAGEPFCPMCGIALSAAPAPAPLEEAKPSPPPEDAFDGTIIMAPDELAQMASSVAGGSSKQEGQPEQPEISTSPADPIVEHKSASEPEPLPEPAHDVFRVEDFEKPKFGNEIPLNEPITLEEPARPEIFGDVRDTKDSVDVRSTSEYRSERAKTLETKTPEEPQPPAPFVQDAASSVRGEELFAASGSTGETTGDSFEETERDIPFSDPHLQPETPNILASETPKLDETPFLDRGFEDVPAPEIAKPEFDLPEYQAEPPIYDSVRIVAPDLPESQDFVNTRIPVSRDLSNEKPAGDKGSGDVDRSHTAQNFGTGTSDGRKASKLKPLSEGAILNNRYEIIRKIGGGGMGAVYLASDNNLGGVLRAVKEMVQAHIEEDQQEKSINDFKRESMILSSLDHPSIPTIFDYFYDDSEGRFYLVMKYISGGDLAARLRSAPEGKIDEITVTDWALQIIDVLNYLHSQPSTIVYRDLKPSNIMIDGNSGRVMLIDFGIARSISQKEEKGVTAVGTMGYAPPELFSGNVEPRSDIYSLGSTMFHLLTGADPQSNPLLIFDFQKNPRPRQINPRLTDQIERILMKAVEYNAESRFASAAEMRAILEQHLANLRGGNVTYGVGEIPASVALQDQTVFCGFCGQRIVATDMFCAFCGSRQPIAQQGVHSVAPAPKAAVTAKLLIEGTTELPMPAFALQKEENLLGRRDPMSNIFPEVDLSKFDPQTKISRRHARIWRQGTNFLVEDLGSSNGTILSAINASAVRLTPHKPQMLSNGDKIKLGDTTLHFVIDQ
jgi:serine/threonine-protein kinase